MKDLSRPLTEHSDDGSGARLRRQWAYLAYDPSDPDFATHQANNGFGPVEEARDADGLRVFTYDWRGLPTSTAHRFWSQADGSGKAWDDSTSDLWTTGTAWDPAVPSAPRDTLTDWLVLDDLTDTTTVTVTATYDAAARPTQMDYPEGMVARMSYNDAGNLQKVEVDRGTGAGFFDVVHALQYDARGKLTSLTHGNGVVTTHAYDPDLERLSARASGAGGPASEGAPSLHTQGEAARDALSASLAGGKHPPATVVGAYSPASGKVTAGASRGPGLGYAEGVCVRRRWTTWQISSSRLLSVLSPRTGKTPSVRTAN